MDNLKVAVIGSGPAGLACANKLVQNGFSVTVFDELSEFGGMLAYGIPSFRIPLESAKQMVVRAKNIGVKFEKRKINSVKQLFEGTNFTEKFDIVVIAIGAGIGIKSGFLNENSSYVIDGLVFLLNDKLNNIKMVNEGEVVTIIGGGNSAVDAARMARKQGGIAKLVYRRTEEEMPASKRELTDAKNEGVEFEFLLSPKEFIEGVNGSVSNEGSTKVPKNELICNVMQLGEMDSSGRRKPIESSITKKILVDKVIVAIGQQNNYNWLEKDGVKTNGKVILIDDNYLTSLENVYACGDVVTGAKTIGEAVLGGTKCAENIIEKFK